LTTVRAIPCLRAAAGDWSKDFDIDYMVDYLRAIPCLRAAGGDWNIDINFMVDYLRAIPCLRAAGGDWSKDFDIDSSKAVPKDIFWPTY
jgi:hypothetical protein